MINVSEQITVGALANNAVEAAVSDPFGREFYLISADLLWNLRSATPGEGAIIVGIAHGDYTDPEIAEHLNVTGMEDPGDQIAKEQGRRLVRRSGQFSVVASEETLNDGKPIRTKGRFVMTDGFALSFWAQNKSGATLTTGQVVNVNGKLYGKWV